jgi:glucuronokinase
MKRVTGQAFARAGLLGNPSDGYHGKTISFIIRQYAATVELIEANAITILPMPEERKSFTSIQDLRKNLSAEGYYGSERLIKAALKKFADYFGETLDPEAPSFSVSVRTNIPRQVGMAGSSAIIIATLRAALSWFRCLRKFWRRWHYRSNATNWEFQRACKIGWFRRSKGLSSWTFPANE